MNRFLMIIIGVTLAGFLGCEQTNPTGSGQTTKFILTVTSSNGSVTLNPAGGTYDSGTVVVLTPVAGSGYMFSNWSGGLIGSGNPVTITMNSNKSVTAVFNVISAGISGTVTIDTVWNKPLEDYTINGDLTINANVTWGRKIKIRIDDGAKVVINGNGCLTIEEGVEVKLGTGSYLTVGYSTAGTLITKGSDSLPILFSKSTGVQNWGYAGSNPGGIILNNKTTDKTVIDHCIIEYALCGISVQGVMAAVTNSKIRNNKGAGIDFVSPSTPKDSASFKNDSITGNGDSPITICPEGLTSLTGNLYLKGNSTDGIVIKGAAAVTKTGTWKNHGIPYLFDVNATIGSAAGTIITIAPGVVCKFNTGAYIQSGYSSAATIVAIGTASQPIVFTKNTGVEHWGSDGNNGAGIVLWDKTTSQTIFDHCIVEYAISGFNILSLPAVITNCHIRNNLRCGIDFNSKAMPKDSASFVNDSITGNGGYPISIVAEGLTRLSGDTYLKGNVSDAIEVTGGNVTQSGTWKKHEAPYFFTSNASLGTATGTTISINPGVVCRFAASAFIQVGYSSSATLIANGTALDSIRFTKTPGSTSWGSATAGIVLWDKTSQNTSFNYCVIDSATAGIWVGNAKINVSNCSIRNNTGNGIVFSAKGSPKDSASFLDNSITGNGDFGVKIYSSNLGNLSGTGKLDGNQKNGIYVIGDAVDADAIWKYHRGAVPYIIDGDIRIGSATGATVTIRPNTRFEFIQDASIVIGYGSTGALIADAYPVDFHGDVEDIILDAIVFTNHIQGTFWGSTANSGAGILMWEGTAGTTMLRNCEINNATGGVFYNTKTNPTIRDCFITQNQTFGIGYFNNLLPHTNVYDNYFQRNASGDTLYLH